MYDRKLAASGDEQPETSQQNGMKSEKTNLSDCQDKAIWEALFYLQAKMLISMSDKETLIWKEELSKVPAWKLGKINEFTGKLPEIWKWFDSLQQEPPTFKALPAPEPGKREREGTIRTLHYCREVGQAKDHAERVKLELEYSKDMKKKFNFTYKPILV